MFRGLGVGIAEWAAKSALMTSPVGGVLMVIWKFLRKIPWQVYAVIFAALMLWIGVRMHAHEVHKTYQSGYNQAIADIKAAEAKKVAPLKTAKAVAEAKIDVGNKGVKKDYDQGNAHISSNVADLLSMYQTPSGSGADAQRGLPQANVGGSPQSAGSPADDGLAQTITLPARELIERSAVCDRDYTALKAWETTYANYMEAYDEWQKTTQAATHPSH